MTTTPEDVDVVEEALRDIADVHVYSSGRYYIPNYAPDSSLPEYGGDTQPGSAWWAECDRLLEQVRAALPPGWTADWDDDDIVIERADDE